MMEGLESLWQDYLNEWQVYVNEHFATGDGAPKSKTAETGIKARFRELLAQYPELTRPQAYMQAAMEIIEPAIGAAVAPFIKAKDTTDSGPSIMRIISAGEMSIITFPQDIALDDFDRMTAEIRVALEQAERRGEQKALAKIAAKGGG